jgi:Leucine-rich repeat (LRR) protein
MVKVLNFVKILATASLAGALALSATRANTEQNQPASGSGSEAVVKRTTKPAAKPAPSGNVATNAAYVPGKPTNPFEPRYHTIYEWCKAQDLNDGERYAMLIIKGDARRIMNPNESDQDCNAVEKAVDTMTTFRLDGSAVKDVGPIAAMKNLVTLDFYDSQLKDVRTLKYLKNLKRFSLIQNSPSFNGNPNLACPIPVLTDRSCILQD